MRKNIAILSILATSLMSYTAMAQNEAPPEGAPPVLDNTPAPAPAPAAAPAAEPMAAAPAAAPDTKFQVGVAFLPMLLGKLKGNNSTNDLAFAYGVGITAGYVIIPGLTAGIAPQAIFNVKDKNGGDAAKEFDIMARIAYAYPVMPQLAVGLEVLPGYSIIALPSSQNTLPNGTKIDNPKGFVVAFGAGAAYDITNMFFVNLGVGYQMGFQSTKVAGSSQDSKTSFLRLAVGGGVKF